MDQQSLALEPNEESSVTVGGVHFAIHGTPVLGIVRLPVSAALVVRTALQCWNTPNQVARSAQRSKALFDDAFFNVASIVVKRIAVLCTMPWSPQLGVVDPERRLLPMIQDELFGTGPAAAIEGWAYESEFLTYAEEKDLLAIIEALPLEDMHYKGHVARRRGSYGGHYDFDANRLNPSTSLPPSLIRCAPRSLDG